MTRSEPGNNAVCVDATVLGKLLKLPACEVQPRMKAGEITGVCEEGEGEHAGLSRVTFFYRNRRARISLDRDGRILQKSAIDYGDQPLPPALRGAGE